MASLSEMTQWRERLARARYSGHRTVQDAGGRRVEYKTDAEMASALAALDNQIAELSGAPVRVLRVHSSKGL